MAGVSESVFGGTPAVTNWQDDKQGNGQGQPLLMDKQGNPQEISELNFLAPVFGTIGNSHAFLNFRRLITTNVIDSVADAIAAKPLRWQFGMNADLETGGGAGSRFVLESFDDSGASLGNQMLVSRDGTSTVLSRTDRIA